jgi:hypothetical protein
MNLLVSNDDGQSFNTAKFPFDFLQSTVRHGRYP